MRPTRSRSVRLRVPPGLAHAACRRHFGGTWIPRRSVICAACGWSGRIASCKAPTRARASVWRQWLPSRDSPISAALPSSTGVVSGSIPVRRCKDKSHPEGLSLRVWRHCGASVGSRPVNTSCCATSPILVWVSRAARRSLLKAAIESIRSRAIRYPTPRSMITR
jgi:hypothetical protein